MGPRARLAAWCSALALALASACDSGSASTSNTRAIGPSMEASGSLPLKVGASMSVPFLGVRRVEARWSDASGPQSLVYRERACGDGGGKFAIDFLELIEPALPPAQAAQLQLLHKLREALFFRYRDFEVRDLDLLSANYTVEVTGQLATVAGRQAERLLIQRRRAPDRRFEVHLDAENGLVLRAREELLDGTLVSLLEFESIDLAPDLSAVALHQSITGEIPLPLVGAAQIRALGFVPHQPRQLPSGFALVEVAKLVDPLDGRNWAKLVYSDGVEVLFFVQAEPPQPARHVMPGQPQGPHRVRSLAVGPWTVLQADFAGRESIAMGKQGELALADAIRSAYP